MASITSDEHSLILLKIVTKSLSDLVAGVPLHLWAFELVRFQDPLSLLNDFLNRNFASVDSLTRREASHLDVESDIASFSGNSQDGSVQSGVDRILHSDRGEIGYGLAVDNTPVSVGRVTFEVVAELSANPGPRTIASKNIFGSHSLFPDDFFSGSL